MNNGKLYNVVKVNNTNDARARLACLPYTKATNEALQEALKEYNLIRDQLATWPNSKDLVVLTVREDGGYDLRYNDNPSMNANLNRQINFCVVEVKGY